MTSRISITKRKYQAIFTEKENKWFTGYEGDVNSLSYYSTKGVVQDQHTTKWLTVKPKGTVRGRSAANLIFEDEDGFTYKLSLKSVDTLLKALASGAMKIKDGYFYAEFCQVKQGQNYFIDFVEE